MIFVGDTHSSWKELFHKIKQKQITDQEIFHVGDMGLGYFDMEYNLKQISDINDFMAERNIILYGIRGNHDNPHYFDGTYSLSNFKLLEDYSVIECEGKNVLCIGGAISPDRIESKAKNMIEIRNNSHSEKRYWWPDEEFNFDKDKLKAFRDIDIVVTHTCPDFCVPVNKKKSDYPEFIRNYDLDDWSLIADLKKEREIITEVHDILKKENDLEYWFYGHFHRSHRDLMGPINYVLLGINELYEVRTDR